jgi:hypothetical protein
VFPPEEVLWISAHSDLLGDPRLGPEQQQRFLPTRFDVDGNAPDAKGFRCHELACPKCHLAIPRALLETEAFFVSILGTPACGKSFYLTAMSWELRRMLPMYFGLSFADADPSSNRTLNEYEELLFLNPKADDLVPLAQLIRKTELQGELYDTVTFGNQTVSYPRPYLFALRPQENHSQYGMAQRVSRVLCLYDNAGEHFLVGQDSTSSPVTQHLARSRLLLFLFDPTQDSRFRKLCDQQTSGQATALASRVSRQETVLSEAAARIRRYAGLSQNAKHSQPLIVVLTKFDAWAQLLDKQTLAEPWAREEKLCSLDLDRIEERSKVLRDLLLRVCPEIVGAAEGFPQNVCYVAVSALGRRPVAEPGTKTLAIRPREIKPFWVTVPLLFGLARRTSGLITTWQNQHAQRGLAAKSASQQARRLA